MEVWLAFVLPRNVSIQWKLKLSLYKTNEGRTVLAEAGWTRLTVFISPQKPLKWLVDHTRDSIAMSRGIFQKGKE